MTLTRPTIRKPQTIAQAKKEFNKYGPRLSSQEQRQLDRGVELYQRAEKIRDKEKRRKENAKRKHEKEQREREARRRMNIASQKPYASPHQLLLEKFVCINKADSDSKGRGASHWEDAQKPGKTKCEPWIEDDMDDSVLLGIVSLDETPNNPVIETITPRSIVHPEDRRIVDGRIGTSNIDEVCNIIGDWDDFFVSNTQIERDISDAPPQRPTIEVPPIDPFLALLSTQDVNLSFYDLEESDLLSATTQQQARFKAVQDPQEVLQKLEQDSLLMPPPRLPIAKIECHAPVIAQDILALDLFSLDFSLSTQDCREIG